MGNKPNEPKITAQFGSIPNISETFVKENSFVFLSIKKYPYHFALAICSVKSFFQADFIKNISTFKYF